MADTAVDSAPLDGPRGCLKEQSGRADWKLNLMFGPSGPRAAAGEPSGLETNIAGAADEAQSPAERSNAAL